MKWMMRVLGNSKEISGWPESATRSTSGLWWNARMDEHPTGSNLRIKGHDCAISPAETMTIYTLTSVGFVRPRLESADGLETIPVDEGRPDCTAQLGCEMGDDTRCVVVGLLWEYQDICAFGPEEMPSINPAVMEYRLNVDLAHKSVVQKKRRMGPERTVAATTVVQKVLEAGFIRECQ